MDFDNINNFFSSPLFIVMMKFFWFFVFFMWISMVYWTYRDAKLRGASPIYWAAVVAPFNVFGWIIYLILRPPELLEDVKERDLEIKSKMTILNASGSICPQCSNAVESDFLICPNCRKRLKVPCPHCHRPLKPSWALCPYCQKKV